LHEEIGLGKPLASEEGAPVVYDGDVVTEFLSETYQRNRIVAGAAND
jgi:hypothetical protein